MTFEFHTYRNKKLPNDRACNRAEHPILRELRSKLLAFFCVY